MDDAELDKWLDEVTADMPPYLEGTIQEAWDRCLPIWREKGRIEDMPRGIRRPRYTPWWGKFLAYEFANKFRDDYHFLIPYLTSEDDFLKICAVELLDYLCAAFGKDPVPEELLALPQPLPAQIKEEVEHELYSRGKGIETVGDLLRFEYPPDDRA